MRKMRKRSLVVGTMTALFCAGMFFMNPDSACAAQGTEAYRAVFDARYYHDAYPDVAEAFGNDSSALFNHFVTYGAKEGRSASAEFNPQAYRARYGDLQTAFGNDMAAYCNHYINFGRAEGRSGAADGSTYSAPKETAAAGTSSAEKTGADTNGTSQTQSVQGTVIGSCTTKYETRIPRAKNVDLAAARINGIVVQPGESFSFSAAILPRTTANGYVEAPIYINGTVGTGIGGGVCQVSSTLYAAMINAGLPATERHAHSLPVPYLPAGYDATIAGTAKDLKFTNIYAQPLVIYASTGGGALTVTLALQ